jgi:hypothetical protein
MIRIELNPPNPGRPRWSAVVIDERNVVQVHVSGSLEIVRGALGTCLDELLRDGEFYEEKGVEVRDRYLVR